MRNFSSNNEDNNKHDIHLIKTNEKIAKQFASEYDPFRKPEVQRSYDPQEHTIIKISAYKTYITFSLIHAKKSNKHVSTAVIEYEQETYKFKNMIINAYEKFSKLIDFKK